MIYLIQIVHETQHLLKFKDINSLHVINIIDDHHHINTGTRRTILHLSESIILLYNVFSAVYEVQGEMNWLTN